MTIDEMIEVLQAAKTCKEIQYRSGSGCMWMPYEGSFFNFAEFDYRVKPEPRRFWIVTGPIPGFSTEKPTYVMQGNEAIEVVEVLK